MSMEQTMTLMSADLPVAARPHVATFDPTPLPIDYVLTYQLAQLAAGSYNVAGYPDPWFVAGIKPLEGPPAVYTGRQDWLTRNNFTPIVNPNGTGDMSKYWGICTVVNNVVIVAFRGTNSISDVQIDLYGSVPHQTGTYAACTAWSVNYGGQTTTVLAHSGFLQTYLTVQANVRQWVQSQFQSGTRPTGIWVVGHSLGGALANLCALDLAAFLGATYPVPKLMTFGCPYVGDQAFATLFNTAVPAATRFALTWDPVTMNPMYGITLSLPPFPPYVHSGQPVALTSPDWVQHFMQGYYWAIAATQPAQSDSGFHPADPVTSLVLKIKTADNAGAGTDADISVNIMGVDWGVLDTPWQTDFGTGDYDTYDLYALFPSKVPASPTVHDITSIAFSMSNIGYFDTYTYSWKLAYVDIRVNQRPFCTVNFNTWIGPGEESGSVAVRTINVTPSFFRNPTPTDSSLCPV
jgi:pimeloyl-ACP methyl ester carboxylesterase